ncbi:hypothetical protein [Paracoccus sp. (in: a-proteobacteria)]|uniref:Acg family FMN-binding oxidoreductase n=1 Tax=Paracoccus sp. TaxID=267 RepID=UPI0032205121
MSSENYFPETAPLREQVVFLLPHAILAPSGHNTQPWLFRITETGFQLIADRHRALPVVDPHDRELAISCGAALGTFEVAARRFGLDPVVNILPDDRDPDLLATIEVVQGAPASAAEAALFDAIADRHTTRAAFAMEPLPDALVETCRDVAAGFGVTLDVIVDEDRRRGIAALVGEGNRRQFDDPRFRRELALWIRSRRSGSGDGMSGAGFGMPDVLSAVGRLMIRTFDMGDGIAAADEKKILAATPALGLLSSPGDGPADWIATGRALLRVLLVLTAHGFTASYLNQPIEVEDLRQRLREVAATAGHPQILLRMGRTAVAAEPSVRRGLESVILGDPDRGQSGGAR